MRAKKKLTKRQQQQMRTHRKHHTKAHLKFMRKRYACWFVLKAAHNAAKEKSDVVTMA